MLSDPIPVRQSFNEITRDDKTVLGVCGGREEGRKEGKKESNEEGKES